jgi:hypothetical protein
MPALNYYKKYEIHMICSHDLSDGRNPMEDYKFNHYF